MVNTKTRPSPSESATQFDVGTIRIGNDGMKYIIAVDKNDKHRWAKYLDKEDTKPTKKELEMYTTEELKQIAEKHLSRRLSVLNAVKKYQEKQRQLKADADGISLEEYKRQHPRGLTNRWKKSALKLEQVSEPEEVVEPVKATKTKRTRKDKKEEEPITEPDQVSEPEEAVEPIMEPEEASSKNNKTAVRKAPRESAKDYDEGYQMLGQDGRIHTVKLTKNGVKRWAHAN